MKWTQLWAERFNKYFAKLIWFSRSNFVKNPQIEVIHWRDVSEGPDVYEYVKRCIGPTYIEPVYGYIISENGYLLEESLLPNFPYFRPPWRFALASPQAFKRAQKDKGKRIQYYPEVISLRHLWEWNYYHFHLDVLGKIQLFDLVGIDTSVPLVLGRYAIELPFVQEVLEKGDLKYRNWIVQDNSYVVADQVYYCRTRQRYIDKMDYILELMGLPIPSEQQGIRVFLTRKKGGNRYVLNMDEIESILLEYEFSIIDSAELSIDEQIDIFSQTRHLVAVHGAGMTNMIFRRGAPMSVLEVYGDYVSVDFRNICYEWGYEHDRLTCRTSGRNPLTANLYIDPGQLRQKIEKMLNCE